jgi:hypothetical protein
LATDKSNKKKVMEQARKAEKMEPASV